ncbi:THO complex subunit 4A-like isoform X2 [Gastrolobium bilobum]|uniref:THO complex subunit 4A-like isoform X2 n=1 Tax=Gastrolobium bilobum TaxID=150636 RepID=UPI002AAF3FEA|nr:THO complex subunit 4A-like isoform X2 [Gastrolobium bilobum]
MSAALDMTLDDIIKNNKKSGSGNSKGRTRGSGSGPGPARRLPNRAANRAAPYTTAPETAWQHDMYADQPVHAAAYPVQGARASSIETGTKLYISNLDYGVSNDDIKELFSEVGDLKRHNVHYDRSGRSKGTAEVVFSRRADAVAAVKRYNNVQLDGKPMKVEIVGTNIATQHAVAPAANGAFGNSNGVPRSGQGRSGAFGRLRGGGGSGGGGRGRGIRRGRGRGRGRDDSKVSAEDLDADLEKYHAESMQLN